MGARRRVGARKRGRRRGGRRRRGSAPPIPRRCRSPRHVAGVVRRHEPVARADRARRVVRRGGRAAVAHRRNRALCRSTESVTTGPRWMSSRTICCTRFRSKRAKACSAPPYPGATARRRSCGGSASHDAPTPRMLRTAPVRCRPGTCRAPRGRAGARPSPAASGPRGRPGTAVAGRDGGRPEPRRRRADRRPASGAALRGAHGSWRGRSHPVVLTGTHGRGGSCQQDHDMQLEC